MARKVIVEIEGISLSLSDWGRKLGVSRERMRQIYNKGCLEEYIKKPDILKSPIAPRKKFIETIEILKDCDGAISANRLFALSPYQSSSYFVDTIIPKLEKEECIIEVRSYETVKTKKLYIKNKEGISKWDPVQYTKSILNL